MRVMGLDVGTKRIGVALSDAMGWTAQPLETVEVKANGEHFKRLAALVAEHGVTTLVAGVPLEMSGQAGQMARRVRRILVGVEKATGLKVTEIDERLTTRQAERALIEGRVGRRDRKEVIDQVAACFILQTHLNAMGGGR